MVEFEYRGVDVDHCVACRGTWLDPGELERLTELAGFTAGELGRALAETPTTGDAGRRCPRCNRRMERFEVGTVERVELERCPKGHGFWLDAGEMEQVVRSFAEGEAGAVARFFSDLYGRELDPQS
jgi:uncharacterized protein